MRRRREQSLSSRSSRVQPPRPVALAKPCHGVPFSKRTRGSRHHQRLAFVPPEDWHEPTENGDGYRLIVQPPGTGFRHVLSAREIHDRLAELPPGAVAPLEVIQLSRMTRKKQGFPCYGMQWGASVYLYPIEQDLVEYYHSPPKPSQVNEARMYGGRWVQQGSSVWKLVWTERTIKDFYLNNVLIHEIGHLLDDRNTRHVDRERFADWFAVRHGYLASQRLDRAKRTVRRRHHA